jgi:Protein of unknown function (DUF2462)
LISTGTDLRYIEDRLYSGRYTEILHFEYFAAPIWTKFQTIFIMVQGAPKKASKAGSSKPNRYAGVCSFGAVQRTEAMCRPKTLGPKPGAKVIKPKKTRLIQKNRIIKKYSSGLTGMTEKNLAQRAGHLELLSGGKKDKKKGTKNAKAKK